MPMATSRPSRQWNLARLAEALLPLIDTDADRAIAAATEVLRGYIPRYEARFQAIMRGKLGLVRDDPEDAMLVRRLLELMEQQGADWTLTFRRLSDALRGAPAAVRAQFSDPAALDGWLADWRARVENGPGTPAERASAMDSVNPVVIPRNHNVEAALDAACCRRCGPVRGAFGRHLCPLCREAGAGVLCSAAAARVHGRLPNLLRHMTERHIAQDPGCCPDPGRARSLYRCSADWAKGSSLLNQYRNSLPAPKGCKAAVRGAVRLLGPAPLAAPCRPTKTLATQRQY